MGFLRFSITGFWLTTKKLPRTFLQMSVSGTHKFGERFWCLKKVTGQKIKSFLGQSKAQPLITSSYAVLSNKRFKTTWQTSWHRGTLTKPTVFPGNEVFCSSAPQAMGKIGRAVQQEC